MIYIFFLIDSTASDRQLMLSILGSAVTCRASSGGGVAPERPSESPNRITRLIADRREKLMKLVARDCGRPLNATSSSAPEPSASGSVGAIKKVLIKWTSGAKERSESERLVGVKRKHGKMYDRRSCWIRRKCAVLHINSDSDNEKQPVDTTQPSTSTGVISRRSRYVANTIESDVKQSSDSSSSSEDNDSSGKKKHSKIDSDASSKVQRRKHGKRKTNSRSNTNKNKNKWVRIQYDSDEEKLKWNISLKGVNKTKIQEDGPPMLVNNSCKIPSTPDSGITSGVSTIEKNSEEAQKGQNDPESSDHEQKLKNLERFRKKVDVARRSYRNRSTPLSQTISTTTDSSD